MAPSDDHHSREADRARRCCAIVSRCDLGGEPHDAVAYDLGISMRQFYRDRSEACVRLAGELECQLAGEQPAAAVATDAGGGLALRLAESLEAVGQFTVARAMLEEVLVESRQPLERVGAYRRLISMLCEAGAMNEAGALLDRVKREFVDGAPNTEALVLQAALLACEATMRWHTDGSDPAMTSATRGVELLRSVSPAALPEAGSLPIDLRVMLATAKRESGAFEEAAKLLDQARANFAPDTSPSTRAMLLLNSGYAHLMMPWGLRRASEENAEALEISQRNGLVRQAATALGNLSVIYRYWGEYDRAASYGRKALMFEPITTQEDFATLAMSVAQIEADAGFGQRGLALVGRIQPHAATNPSLSARLKAAQAYVLVALRRFDLALAFAKSAQRELERLGLRRRIGVALCTQAEAYAALDERRLASSTIRDAVDALEREGSAFALANAYRISARITGNVKHRTSAVELMAAIRA
jgi:tetratricopeptide (TPR) repeat protein